MRSSDGPLEAAMIRCPSGHWFNGPIESLTWEGKHQHEPGNAAVASGATYRFRDGPGWYRNKCREAPDSFPRSLP